MTINNDVHLANLTLLLNQYDEQRLIFSGSAKGKNLTSTYLTNLLRLNCTVIEILGNFDIYALSFSQQFVRAQPIVASTIENLNEIRMDNPSDPHLMQLINQVALIQQYLLNFNCVVFRPLASNESLASLPNPPQDLTKAQDDFIEEEGFIEIRRKSAADAAATLEPIALLSPAAAAQIDTASFVSKAEQLSILSRLKQSPDHSPPKDDDLFTALSNYKSGNTSILMNIRYIPQDETIELQKELEISLFDPVYAQKIIQELEHVEIYAINVKKYYIEICPLITWLLRSLDLKLNSYPYDKKVTIRLVTELITFSFFQFNYNDSSIQILSPSLLTNILQDAIHNPLNGILFNLIYDDFYKKYSNVCQLILLFYHLNFNSQDKINEIRKSSLFERVFVSPYLKEFIFSVNCDVRQLYRETCVGTAYNHIIQSRCGTFVELLFILKKTIKFASENLRTCSIASTDAYKTHFGTPTTIKVYVDNIISMGELEATNLETNVELLMDSQNITSQKIKSITTNWNYSMQLLQAIINPNEPVLLLKQFLPEHYLLSSALSTCIALTKSCFSSNPRLEDYWKHGIDPVKLKILIESFFNTQAAHLPSHSVDKKLVDHLKIYPEDINKIWDAIYLAGGGVIHFSKIKSKLLVTSNDNLLLGHAICCFAVRSKSDKRFVLYDPMRNKEICSQVDLVNMIISYDHVYISILRSSLKNLFD